ncbi:hypothetical protein K438DRAFT_805057 [Mycena galopus ATCC 62051]|nr:hypothetical protein K438DRAFT_805057 [Mycena galopus ATCC 62051]
MDLLEVGASTTSIFNIQELVDLIIDFLAPSRSDLYASALVSAAWVSRSQYHIFGGVKLNFVPEWNEVLGASSRLVSLVHKVELHLDLVSLESFNKRNWVNLEEVAFRGAGPDLNAEISSIPLVQKILRLPRLCRVDISGDFHSYDTITGYFEDCSQRIHTLLLSARLCSTSDGVPRMPYEPGSHRTGRINLSHIGISVDFYRWIVCTQCPFNISRVNSIDVWESEWTRFQLELGPHLASLKSLTLLDITRNQVDVSMFPALEILHVWINSITDGIPQLGTTLSRLPSTNKLRTLALSFWVNPLYHADQLVQFDQRVTGLSTVASLNRVEILSTPWLPGDQLETVRPLFPTLAASHRLFLTASERDLLSSVHVV